MKRLMLGLASLMVCSGIHAEFLGELVNSYTRLPAELKELSIIDGAIAIEQDLLESLFVDAEAFPSSSGVKLIKKLFTTPTSDEFRLTQSIPSNAKKASILSSSIQAF